MVSIIRGVGGGGGSALIVTDGTTTVSPTNTLEFVAGTVTDAGSGVAQYDPDGTPTPPTVVSTTPEPVNAGNQLTISYTGFSVDPNEVLFEPTGGGTASVPALAVTVTVPGSELEATVPLFGIELFTPTTIIVRNTTTMETDDFTPVTINFA